MKDTDFYESRKSMFPVPEGVDPATIHSFEELSAAYKTAKIALKPLNEFIEDTSVKMVIAAKDTTTMKNEIARLEKEGRIITGVGKAFDSIGKGSKESKKAMKELKDAVGVTNRAFTAMNYINQDGKKNAELMAEAYEDVGKAIGWSAEEVNGNAIGAFAE